MRSATLKTNSTRPFVQILLILSLSVFLVQCKPAHDSTARASYNDGIEWMAEGKLDDAEASFIAARNEAKGDQSVRYSAAFNLGMLHVRKADELELSEPAQALEELAQARHWFQDAARVRSDDTDARANLQIVGRKAEVLADQMNQGENKLEAKLDRAIEEERGLRDQIRELLEAVKESGTQADPIAFRGAFDGLATTERVLMAESGVISDLAMDELAGLDGQNPEEMSQEDKIRQVQLRNLDVYLQSARVAIDDSRRALRMLDATQSHARATAALSQLKRAREQLWDPITALKAVAQDQQLLLSHTSARLQLGKQELAMPGEEKTTTKIPAWLSADHLAQRQGDAIERSSQVLQQFQAAASAPPPEDPSTVEPETARMLEMAEKAVPFLQASVDSMKAAQVKLVEDAMSPAFEQETEAMRSLLRAIEHFSDLRNLIELSYAEQLGIVAMLDPTRTAGHEDKPMSTEERATASRQAGLRNVDRLARMTALIQSEMAAAKAEQAQANQGQPADPNAPDSIGQTYEEAEKHRGLAAAAMTQLETVLSQITAGQLPPPEGESPLDLATTGEQEIEELRRLFYSIVEHLKELQRNQSETLDSTGTMQAASDEERVSLLPPIAQAQQGHFQMADALANALEKQADAASASEDPKAAQEAEKFSSAAAEVRLALEAMKRASTLLDAGGEQMQSASVDFGPVLEEQPVAVEHIAAAIAILEPPQDQEDQDEDQDQQDQDQKDQEQQEQQEEASKQQAEKRLQEIRDREAERQREREENQRVQSGGVDKDW